MNRLRHFAGLTTLILAGCASAPIQYLTLVPPPGGRTANDGGPAAGVPAVSVTIPSQVDQPQLVIRQADGSMALLESERWIAPLGDELRNALSLSLAHQWQAEPEAEAPPTRPAASAPPAASASRASSASPPTAVPPAPPDTPARVAVDVQRFDSVPGQYALIDAVWTLSMGGTRNQKVTCRSSIRIPVAGGYPALAQAHQAAIEKLASQIAAQGVKLRSAGAATDTACDAPQ